MSRNPRRNLPRNRDTRAHSGTAGAPIVFEAYNNEPVFVSGADPIVGWSDYKGSIYQGDHALVAVGRRKRSGLRRWPDDQRGSLPQYQFPDPSHPTLAQAAKVSVSGSTATLYDPNLTQAANYWKRPRSSISRGARRGSPKRETVISSHNVGQITFSFIPSLTTYEMPSVGNGYYLTGTFKRAGLGQRVVSRQQRKAVCLDAQRRQPPRGA